MHGASKYSSKSTTTSHSLPVAVVRPLRQIGSWSENFFRVDPFSAHVIRMPADGAQVMDEPVFSTSFVKCVQKSEYA